VRSSEWIAVGYFAASIVAAWTRSLPFGRRFEISAAGAIMCAAVPWVAHNGSVVVRDWFPLVVILAAYYLSGRFFIRPSERVEQWLLGWDRRLLGDVSTRFARWPRVWLACLDIAYMGCFLVVPGGFAALVATGQAALADRYWTIVVFAELGSFAPLWVVETRPPWAIEPRSALRDRAIHRLASGFVNRFTHRANTFPSGHAAGSLAVALSVMVTLPRTGAALLALAILICISAVIGRYHYTMDVVIGAILAVAVWALVALV
jgi:membrane-associated phospholipid phosphatase